MLTGRRFRVPFTVIFRITRSFILYGRRLYRAKKNCHESHKTKTIDPSGNEGKEKIGDAEAKVSSPAAGTELAEKSISEQARQNSVTHRVQFPERSCRVFPTGCRGDWPSPPGNENSLRVCTVTPITSHTSVCVVDEKKRGGRRKMSRLWKSRGDETVTCHVPRQRTSFPLARAKW